jgi:hypothetical protein
MGSSPVRGYEGSFSAFDILYMDARSLSGSSGYTVAFGRWLSAFSCFPRRLALKFEGQVISAAAPISLIVALYRLSKVMFQMIRATRVQKVAVFEHFVLRCGVKLCIQSLTGCANHSTRISNLTLSNEILHWMVEKA